MADKRGKHHKIDYNIKKLSKANKPEIYISNITKLESNCDNGLSCMIKAYEVYQNEKDPVNSKTMDDISKYNKFDCKVLGQYQYFTKKVFS